MGNKTSSIREITRLRSYSTRCISIFPSSVSKIAYAASGLPTDVGGRTLIKAHHHPRLTVGDAVRCEDVIKRWYNGDPTFET